MKQNKHSLLIDEFTYDSKGHRNYLNILLYKLYNIIYGNWSSIEIKQLTLWKKKKKGMRHTDSQDVDFRINFHNISNKSAVFFLFLINSLNNLKMITFHHVSLTFFEENWTVII